MAAPRPTYTRKQLAATVRTAKTVSDALRILGVVPRGGNYEVFWDRVSRWQIKADHLRRHHTWNGFSDAEVRHAIMSSASLAGAQRKLRRDPNGSGFRFLRAAVSRLGLDTSHMTGAGWRLGATNAVVPAQPLEEVLVKGRLARTARLRERLVREGLRLHRCQQCHRRTWMRRPIPLELDHINGDRSDNRLENLRLLCPNCHAQTETYRGRNIGKRAWVV